jgi:cell pole-organizing protein PopZ
LVRQAGEPSVEEILASIKKVIARDNRAEADQVRRRRENEGVVTARAMPAEAPVAAASVAYPAGDEPPAVLELTDAEMAPEGEEWAGDEPDAFAEEEEDEAEPQAEAPAAPPADAPLLAETARSSVRESLTALAMLAEPGARPQIVRSGETSLEGLVRELLRPMLAEWLEKNLPDTVDRLVAAEISRIVGKRG